MREALERVVRLAPERRESFKAELWRRVDLAERKARRRRATATLLTGALALAALTAGGVFALGRSTATTVVDETIMCPVPDQGGVNVLHVAANPKSRRFRAGSAGWEQNPGAVGAWIVAAGQELALAEASTDILDSHAKPTHTGYILDKTVCKPTARISLARAALPLVGHVDGLSRFGVGGECWVAPTVTIRLRVYLTGNAATSAELAIRGGAKRNPLVYAQWAPTRVRYYAGPACDH